MSSGRVAATWVAFAQAGFSSVPSPAPARAAASLRRKAGNSNSSPRTPCVRQRTRKS
ncbi:hypothetical protein [Azospirillum argentinense]|uniref:hypothetical protein n=1 Tax=Azospirillum argentinense TaxID=2970906 RepID=UPI00190E7775|nr:hypothetical protein [Azospirillum argentinense]